MQNKKIISLVIGVIALILGIGFSLGFYTASNNTGKNSGNEVGGSTNKTLDTIFKSEELLKPNNTNIYPGHQSIAAIKVTATGVNDVVYDLTWSGTNTLGNYNYTLYKGTTKERPNINCEVKTKYIENVGNTYFEECNASLTNLGNPIAKGHIAQSNDPISLVLRGNEIMSATSEGNIVYYYLVLEFPNLDVAQSGQGGQFEGTFNATKNTLEPDVSIIATYIEQDDGTYKVSKEIPNKASGYGLNTEKSVCNNDATLNWDYNNWSLNVKSLTLGGTSCNLYFSKGTTMDAILTKYNTSVRTDFSTPYAETTTKTVFTAEDDYGTSKYFAGAPSDNYVKFGGFYWRIIRMNGDQSTRLIYTGESSVIDSLANKQVILANGYDDRNTKYTQIKESAFNSLADDNAYVGFKYTVGELRGLSEKSTILSELDAWYEANLKTNSGKYIDGSVGFCGNRTPSTVESSSNGSGGTGTTKTYYKDNINLYKYKRPKLSCENTSDLYTTRGSSRGNKALTNPIGLINANEVAFAGGVYGQNNTNYYLRNGLGYWTMSPSHYIANASCSYLLSFGAFGGGAVNGAVGVRPVINLAASTKFVGTGTWDDPYTVVEF